MFNILSPYANAIILFSGIKNKIQVILPKKRAPNIHISNENKSEKVLVVAKRIIYYVILTIYRHFQQFH